MKFIRLTNSKRVLTNRLFTNTYRYINPYNNMQIDFVYYLYKEKSDVFGLFDYYVEVCHKDKVVVFCKVVFSPAERSYLHKGNKEVSSEYFYNCLEKLFNSFKGKTYFQRYITELATLGSDQ